MEQYIPKSALVAEIESKRKYAQTLGDNAINSSMQQFYDGMKQGCVDILSFINNLEVKEVDLEKEHKDWLHQHFNGSRDHNASGDYLQRSSQLDMAKYFFELGLKAQHDNWKVVDNINPPQADKNKIYCVFTNDRYILATVINHPKDEDLLQWKCTEFPFHRYDMCEGDKYMQIV